MASFCHVQAGDEKPFGPVDELDFFDSILHRVKGLLTGSQTLMHCAESAKRLRQHNGRKRFPQRHDTDRQHPVFSMVQLALRNKKENGGIG